MIDFYYWPTPNGHKVTIFLEESGLPYTIKPVNIGRGEQFTPAFLAISPNNRMPAIVDQAPPSGGGPQSVFESGAILLYLAEKTGLFLSRDAHERIETLEWLFWQMGGVGPMFGQAGHFRNYAPEKIPYAIDRYTNEVNRLYGVLNRRLEGREFITKGYSIADMAIFPWVQDPTRFGQDPAQFPNVVRWAHAIKERPAVVRALAKGESLRSAGLDEEAKKVLFGQTAGSVSKAVETQK